MEHLPNRTDEIGENALLELVEGDRELLKELIVTFLHAGPEMLNSLREASTRRDAEGIHRAAHTLRGSVGNFTMGSLYFALSELEKMAGAQQIHGTDRFIQNRIVPELRGLGGSLTRLKEKME
jgi:HPt (histidine-containing phosphotransfer) domain-containing protein